MVYKLKTRFSHSIKDFYYLFVCINKFLALMIYLNLDQKP